MCVSVPWGRASDAVAVESAFWGAVGGDTSLCAVQAGGCRVRTFLAGMGFGCSVPTLQSHLFLLLLMRKTHALRAAEGAAAETEHQGFGWNVGGACARWSVPRDACRFWDQTDVIGVSFAKMGP